MGTTITDKMGRSIALRHVGVLEMLRLYKALGPELAMNEAYVGLASAAAAVAVLDGVPMPFPNGELAVEHVLERLGDEGAAAVMAALAPEPVETVIAAAGN